MNVFTRVASGIYLEGLSFDAQRNAIWYSDVIGGGIHGVDTDGKSVSAFNAGRRWTGGVLMNSDGAVLSSGPGGIMWNHPDSGRSGWLIEQIEGAPINGINELVPDGVGGVIFGTSDIESVIAGASPRPTELWRLTRERRLILLASDIGFANGLMLDQERRRLYCNDTFRGTWVFDVDGGLRLSNRRLLVEKEDADGMALDAEGTLWISGFRSSAFTRIASDGRILKPFETPAGAITQLRFGGQALDEMYFNSVPCDAGDSLKDGRALTQPISFLYRTRASVRGMAVGCADFELG